MRNIKINAWVCCLLMLNIFSVGIALAQNTDSQFPYQYNKNWVLGGMTDEADYVFSFNNRLIPGATAIGTNAYNSRGGGASISDQNGNLLFYTNGKLVYNKNHQLMANGDGLLGGSRIQSALIVPSPANRNQYYIFTVPAYTSSTTNSIGLRYSIVDMSDGVGEVISKNVLLDSRINERVAATYHQDGESFWIVAHLQNSNAFVAYRLSSTGFSSGVLSNVGGVLNGDDRHGMLRFSADGNKLVSVLGNWGSASGSNVIELFNFNNATGQLSNPATLATDQTSISSISLKFVVTAEFSSNGTKLYVASRGVDNGYLFQFDLSSNPIANRILVAYDEDGQKLYSSPQLGPDGKIYLRNTAWYVGIIHNPNSFFDCNFQSKAIRLPVISSSLGVLQNTVQYPILNYPPVPEGLPANKTITIWPGQTENLDVRFYSPEQDQTTSVTVSSNFYNINGFQVVSNQAGNPALTRLSFTATGTNAGTHTIILTGTDNGTPARSTSETLTVIVKSPICQFTIPKNTTGSFKVGKQSGRIVYQRAGSCPVEMAFSCLSGTPNPDLLPNVVSAQAVTYADQWSYDESRYTALGSTPVNANAYEKGTAGKWRPKANYIYNSPLIAANTKNYNHGVFDLSFFNWQHEPANNTQSWLLQSKTTRYSPHGEGLEEVNALDIPSTVKFGYYDAVPYLTAQNAHYNTVLFESFEIDYDPTNRLLLEDGFVSGHKLDNTHVHSGKKALMLMTYSVALPQIHGKDYPSGMLVKVWVRVPADRRAQLGNNMRLNFPELSQSTYFSVVAQVGEWSLCEAKMPALNDRTIRPIIEFPYSPSGTIWIDDLRIQPADAHLKCYVYDPDNLRLLTIFDDQHFGLFYQYNAEGKLVRKKVETQRGVQTVEETHYNLRKQ